jgi:DNA invertase Pin-like site-specific DNA recombinase
VYRVNNARTAVGYLRVEADRDIALEDQRCAIEAWAARSRITVASWKADEGIGGSTPIAERPGLVSALGAVRELGAGVLVAARRDRFACEMFVAGLIEQAALASGARLLTADSSDAEAKKPAVSSGEPNGGAQSWTRGALDLFVSYQRAINRAKTREALAAKKRRNERTGTVPYGYRLATDGIHLEPDAAEQAVLARVRELAAAGLSQQKIVENLAAHGVVGRTGAPLKKTQIARMLVRAAA